MGLMTDLLNIMCWTILCCSGKRQINGGKKGNSKVEVS